MTPTPTTTSQAVPLACPECLDTAALSTVEQLTGNANTTVVTRVPGMPPTFGYTGDSVAYWEDATQVGMRCRSCNWSYVGEDWADRLLTPDQVEAAE